MLFNKVTALNAILMFPSQNNQIAVTATNYLKPKTFEQKGNTVNSIETLKCQ